MKKTGNAEIEQLCQFCEHATPLHEIERVLCEKKGIVDADYCCRSFCYDVLKRQPAAPRKIAPLEYVSLDGQ